MQEITIPYHCLDLGGFYTPNGVPLSGLRLERALSLPAVGQEVKLIARDNTEICRGIVVSIEDDSPNDRYIVGLKMIDKDDSTLRHSAAP